MPIETLLLFFAMRCAGTMWLRQWPIRSVYSRKISNLQTAFGTGFRHKLASLSSENRA